MFNNLTGELGALLAGMPSQPSHSPTAFGLLRSNERERSRRHIHVHSQQTNTHNQVMLRYARVQQSMPGPHPATSSVYPFVTDTGRVLSAASLPLFKKDTVARTGFRRLRIWLLSTKSRRTARLHLDHLSVSAPCTLYFFYALGLMLLRTHYLYLNALSRCSEVLCSTCIANCAFLLDDSEELRRPALVPLSLKPLQKLCPHVDSVFLPRRLCSRP